MREWKYSLGGEVPSKKNSRVTCRRTGRSFPNRRFRDWHCGALADVLRQGVPAAPIPCAVVRLHFLHSTLRRRDGDNQLSSVLDLLVDAGVLKDDSWANVPRVEAWHSRAKYDLCEVVVNELEYETGEEAA